MAGFVQLVEYETSDLEAVKAALERFREEHPGVLTFSVSKVGEDRERPGTYISIVEFDSYEQAMEQSNNPATTEMTGKIAELMGAPPRFRNLDVRWEITT